MRTTLKMFSMTMTIAATAAIVACGDASQAPSENAQHASSASDVAPSRVCSLLTREQVATVVPDNDGGRDQDTSEASLLKDVGMERCRYFHVEGTDMQFLDVIIYKATSDEGFKKIEIGEWAHHDSSRKLDIGDIGFLHDMSEQDEMVATASKGKTVFELKLSSKDAAAKSEQLVKLARIVVGKL